MYEGFVLFMETAIAAALVFQILVLLFIIQDVRTRRGDPSPFERVAYYTVVVIYPGMDWQSVEAYPPDYANPAYDCTQDAEQDANDAVFARLDDLNELGLEYQLYLVRTKVI